MTTAHDVAAVRLQLARLLRDTERIDRRLYGTLAKAEAALANAQAFLELNEDPRQRELYAQFLASFSRDTPAGAPQDSAR